MSPRPEYVVDVPYDRTFVPDLAPSRLRLVAALNGFAPPPSRDFDYLELGAGQGFTTATLAAACPTSRFLGVDLMPDHVESARRLALAGGLSNVSFVQGDFGDSSWVGAQTFDYVAAHGVMSWIGPDKRAELLRLASSRLKPGGLLYVSYNALPGWSAVEPLRRLIAERADAASGDSLARAKAGVALAERLEKAGAEYFTANPSAGSTLETMRRAGMHYVAHEALHAHWVPMYFADVARELAAVDLYFVGQLPLYLNYRDMAVPAGLAEALSEAGDRLAWETLKDYARNEFFRCDVFVKGRPVRSDLVTSAYLDATPMLATDLPLRREVRMPHQTITFATPMFEALVEAFDEGPWSAAELAARPALLGIDPARVRDAVLKLILTGQLSPATRLPRSTKGKAGALVVPSAYNRAVLALPLSHESPVVLVSEALGTGVTLGLLESVALRLLTEVAPEGWDAWLTDLLQRQPFRLRDARGAVEEPARVKVMAIEEVARFKRTRLHRMLDLGVLARA